MATAISIILAYLIGSLSGALIIAKMLGLPDPRSIGSGNAGATNMKRVGGTKVGVMVLIFDLVKGLVAVILGHLFGVHPLILGMVAFAAVLGHVFPVFFQFKGGKGVATALGCLIGLAPWVGLVVALTWIIVAYLFKYSSLASLVATIAAPIYILIGSNNAYFVGVVLIAALVIFKHTDNIKRLRRGEESRLKF